MRRLLTAILLGACCVAAPAFAAAPRGDAVSAPARGSEQRRAILDALRPAVEAELGPAEFVVDRIHVRRGWAFVLAQPQRPGGGAIDVPPHMRDWAEIGGLEVSAVLRFRDGRWNLVDHGIGATDVWYCDLFPKGGSPAPECR